jgi:hypothetical protein
MKDSDLEWFLQEVQGLIEHKDHYPEEEIETDREEPAAPTPSPLLTLQDEKATKEVDMLRTWVANGCRLSHPFQQAWEHFIHMQGEGVFDPGRQSSPLLREFIDHVGREALLTDRTPSLSPQHDDGPPASSRRNSRSPHRSANKETTRRYRRR